MLLWFLLALFVAMFVAGLGMMGWNALLIKERFSALRAFALGLVGLCGIVWALFAHDPFGLQTKPKMVAVSEHHPPAMLRCSNGVHYCMLVIALPQEELVGVDSKNSILLANADTGVLKVGFFYRKSGLNDPWAPISAKVAPSWRESQLEVDGHPVDLAEVKFVQIVTVGRPDEVFKTVAVRHK